MAQTFQVLRCYRCSVFQVHPTKKAIKWNCKLCDEKQSIKRFYGLGTGKECRILVQKLNRIRGQIDDATCDKSSNDCISSTASSSGSEQEEAEYHPVPKISKWLRFVDAENEDQQQSSDHSMHSNDTEVVLELTKKRPRESQNITKESSKHFNDVENSSAKVNSSIQYCDALKMICEIVPMKVQNNTIIAYKRIKQPPVGISKWAKLIEELDKDPIQEEPKSLFSFYDEDELDAVLDL